MSGRAVAQRVPVAEQHRCPAAVGDGQATADGRPTVRQADWSRPDSDTTVKTADPGVSCTQRLKFLLRKAMNEEVNKEELIAHLGYVVNVLDSTFSDDSKGVFDAEDDDDDDELGRVEAEAVPNEVRDWLAQTFTRSTTSGASKRLSGDSKPRFRSVANAIRAGILVDRIYRRITSPAGLHVPSSVAVLLKSIDEWSFDVFAINAASEGNALKFVGYELLQKYDLISKFKISISTLENFLARLQRGYSKHSNPYHNLVHAADVTQTIHYLISRSGLSLWLTDLEILAAIFAALIHDYEHTGTTNTFHVNTGSDVALLYNDKAVLENHHLSATFRLLVEDDYNVVSSLKTEEYREFRSTIIDIVLATDMSFHFQQIKNMKAHLNSPESIDKTKALSLIVHCADISHPSKAWKLHHRWTEQLIEEFFRQGDLEEVLGLSISPLCDRKNTHVAESQIGFIDFIVDPSMQVMGDMLERIVQSSAQQSTEAAAAAPPQTGASDVHVGSGSSKPGDDGTPSAANGGANSSKLTPILSEFELKRPWEACLVINKQMWKERAAQGWISPLQEPTSTAAAKTRTDVVDDQADSGVESPGPRSTSSTEPPPPPPPPQPPVTSIADSRTMSPSQTANTTPDCHATGRYETPVAGAAVNLLDGVVAAKTGINADVSRQQHSTAHAYSVADAKLPAGVRQSNV